MEFFEGLVGRGEGAWGCLSGQLRVIQTFVPKVRGSFSRRSNLRGKTRGEGRRGSAQARGGRFWVKPEAFSIGRWEFRFFHSIDRW